MVNWVAPLGNRQLTYTVIYETLSASDQKTMSDITGLTHTFSSFQVFDTPCVVAVQSRDVVTGLFGSFSYLNTSDCFINAIAPPSPPVVTNASYGCNLFELKWSPPSDTIVNIMEYIVVVVNSSASTCSGFCGRPGHEFRVHREITSFSQTFPVSENTCFCATVYASNTFGRSAQSNQVSFVHQYVPTVTTIFQPITVPFPVPTTIAVPMTVVVTETSTVTSSVANPVTDTVTSTVTTTKGTVTDTVTITKVITSIMQVEIAPTIIGNTGVSETRGRTDDDDDDDVPIVAIILAVVLVALVIATTVLGLVFCLMYLRSREANDNEKT